MLGRRYEADPQQEIALLAQREARGPPVDSNAPSNPWTKGPDFVEPTQRRLADEGIIEYRQVVGVLHARMPRLPCGRRRGADHPW